MNILVLNVGSSSLKFRLIHTTPELAAADGDLRLAGGVIERIGDEASIVSLERSGEHPRREVVPIADVADAVRRALLWVSGGSADRHPSVDGVGHRVVHGGEHFRASAVIDEAVRRRIEEVAALAPLHNPHNLRGIDAAREALGEAVPQVAVFDTAFHQTIPEHAYLYAVPRSLYERHGVRRFGFHGTSHRYVSERWHRLTGRPAQQTRLITLHLGNGCSACAIRGGKSVDTSMGFTPLEGLVMGTRSGDVDPAILPYIAEREGIPLAEVLRILNHDSGLLGVSGSTHDVRDLLEQGRAGDERARLALRIFAHRARKYVGAYLVALGGAEAIVFTGGIGENAAELRALICDDMEWAGLPLDHGANDAMVGGAEGRISQPGARLEAWVIPTDEERMIARDTMRLLVRGTSYQ